MSGFEPGSSDNGNNRSANCATTTALVTMSLVISFMLYSNALNLSSLTSFLKLLKRLPHSSHHILNKLTIDFSSPFVYALTSFGSNYTVTTFRCIFCHTYILKKLSNQHKKYYFFYCTVYISYMTHFKKKIFTLKM